MHARATVLAAVQVVQQSTPPELNRTITAQDLQGLALAQLQDSLPLDDALCNVDLPQTTVLDRFMFVVDHFARNGEPLAHQAGWPAQRCSCRRELARACRVLRHRRAAVCAGFPGEGALSGLPACVAARCTPG